MRIYVESYAYEIKQERDPRTQLLKSWQYIIYRIRPFDEVVVSGFKGSREDAEREAKSIVAKFEKDAKLAQTA